MLGCIYARFEDPDKAITLLKSRLPSAVQVRAKVWRRPGDEVSKMILGLHSAITSGDLECSATERDAAVARVDDANCVLVLSDDQGGLNLEMLRGICSDIKGVLL